jgi:hypothetical protein
MTEKEQWDAAQAYQITGGPAFPVMLPEAKIVYTGMTLRDYFAAKAMQALLPKATWAEWEVIPKDAYAMADIMLKERLK